MIAVAPPQVGLTVSFGDLPPESLSVVFQDNRRNSCLVGALCVSSKRRFFSFHFPLNCVTSYRRVA